MFIPEYKMPRTDGPVAPVAVISQSGAFGISRASRLGRVNPRYVITVGNQMDVTVGDYLSYLAHDTSLEVFAVYVEGFKPLDGLRFLEAAREIVLSGRRVIFYRAGRTAEGARASASHTASIAGDYRVTRAMCEQAGVILAESLADFDDLVSVCALLRDCDAPGTRLGAMSNAGFESVAIADALQGGLTLVPFAASTCQRIQQVLAHARIDTLVDVHNPLDVTPMADDATFADIASLLLTDDHVDAAVIGCVPMTGALTTLPAADRHREDLDAAQGIVSRLGALRRGSRKPWVAVVDAGGLYDALASALERESIPTFRTADRAVRVLSLLARHKAHTLQAEREDGGPTTARVVHRSGDVA
jgi:acyl-CoA synthetase (NDP forming)